MTEAHDCDLPPLDFVPYGEEWACPVCGQRYVKAEYDDERAYWERD